MIHCLFVCFFSDLVHVICVRVFFDVFVLVNFLFVELVFVFVCGLRLTAMNDAIVVVELERGICYSVIFYPPLSVD